MILAKIQTEIKKNEILFENFGIVGITFIATGMYLASSLAEVGTFLVFLSFVFLIGDRWTHFKKSPFFWAASIWLVYFYIHGALFMVGDPDLSDGMLRTLRKLWVAWPIIMIPVILHRKNLSHYFFLAYSISFILYTFQQLDWSIASLIGTSRPDLRNLNPQHYGLLSGISFFVFIYLLYHLWPRLRMRARLVMSLMLLMGGSMSLQILLLSQSRGPWVAFFGALLFSSLLTYGFFLRKSSFKVAALATLVLLGTIAISTYHRGDGVYDRLTEETSVIIVIINDGIENAPPTSWGKRAHLLAAGIRAIQEKPLLGWGWGAANFIIQHDDFIHEEAQHYNHFHNQWVDVGVRLGLLGMVLFIAVFAALFYGIYRNIKYEKTEWPFAVFACAVIIIIAIAFSFESYLSFFTWWQNFSLFAGLIAAWFSKDKILSAAAKG
jgi:O-antigen ligase